jgi:uncharacterized membrane protein
MTTLAVWRFPESGGARSAVDLLERLQKAGLLQFDDAAIVSWPEGRKKPKTEHLQHLAGRGAFGGAFWGLLFGVLFLVPLLGLAVGVGMGAVVGSMFGIDDRFISAVREKITPGTSALFVMTARLVGDQVLEAFRDVGAELVSTDLSGEQAGRLREVFAEHETV